MRINNTLLFLILSGSLQAQVGIGVKDTQGVFHIDPKLNTTKAGNIIINNGDDLLFSEEGNLGIGTASPLYQLSLVGDNIHHPVNIQHIQNFTGNKTVYNLAVDVASNVGTVSYTKVPTVFFSLLEQTKGLDIGNSNSKINLPIGSSQVEFNTASITFGNENNTNFLSIANDGVYSIETIANFLCDTDRIWGVNLIISKKELNQTTYSVIDSRRIVTKLGNEANSNNNIALPGKYFGVFSLKQGDRVSIDVGTGFAATGVNAQTCGTHKPGLNTSAMNFIIKKID